MTPKQRFAQDHNIPLHKVNQLCSLANRRGQIATHECNGDPHPSLPNSDDKNANAKAWGKDDDQIRAKFETLAKELGFTGVDYPGLYPTLRKNNLQFHLPL